MRPVTHIIRLMAVAAAAALPACATPPVPIAGSPPLTEFCLEAQRVVVRTAVQPALVVHADFDSFVRSKATIEPLTIQQYIWYEDDDPDRPLMISCKLKSADHLNETFGTGTAAGNGQCQDMNRLTYDRVRAALGAVNVEPLRFDPVEEVRNAENPGMTGPDWLMPFEMTGRDASGVLQLRTKGFRVDWTDPRFAAMPGRFRGVQYCHLVAPDYLARLVTGRVKPGVVVGREVAAPAQAPGQAPAHAPAPAAAP